LDAEPKSAGSTNFSKHSQQNQTFSSGAPDEFSLYKRTDAVRSSLERRDVQRMFYPAKNVLLLCVVWVLEGSKGVDPRLQRYRFRIFQFSVGTFGRDNETAPLKIGVRVALLGTANVCIAPERLLKSVLPSPMKNTCPVKQAAKEVSVSALQSAFFSSASGAIHPRASGDSLEVERRSSRAA
jgi:hypothetical protein